MEQVYVREAASEVLVIIGRNTGCRLLALQEAAKIIQREVIREQTITGGDPNRSSHGDQL